MKKYRTATEFLLVTCPKCGCGRPNHPAWFGPCRNCHLCPGFPVTPEAEAYFEELWNRLIAGVLKSARDVRAVLGEKR